MAFEYLIRRNEENSLTTRYLQAYLRDPATSPQVRLVEAVIPINATPASLNLQALWETGTVVPSGAKRWREYELKDTDDVGVEAIDAMLEVLRVTPFNAALALAAMITAGETALAGHPRQLVAYNRLVSALNAVGVTNAQRMQFLALVSTVAFGKIGQR